MLETAKENEEITEDQFRGMLESRWGFRWVQEHAQDVAKQLAAAKRAQGDAQTKLTDYQNNHPVTGSPTFNWLASQVKSVTGWSPGDPTRGQLQTTRNDACGQASYFQNELDLIKANYGLHLNNHFLE